MIISTGWADSQGCLTTPAVAGSFIIRIYPALNDGAKTFYMYSNTSNTWEAFEGTGTLPGLPSGTQEWWITHASATGIGNMAAVASNAIGRPSMGMKPGVNYVAYTDQGCPGGGFGACYDPNSEALYLGTSQAGVRTVFTKHVVGHELGHEIGANLAGNAINGAYGADGCTDDFMTPDMCTLPPECIRRVIRSH